ncbi:MAG: hypothetical protein GY778_03230 [bacterium]|nr:hypothetical protein [bacterium]
MEFVPTDLPDLLGSGVWPLLKRFGPALIGLGIGIFLLIPIWRRSRRYLQPDEPLGDQIWTLHDLRRLHAEGQLQDAEYERLRAKLLGLSTGDQESNRPAEAETPVTGPKEIAPTDPDAAQECPQCKHSLNSCEQYCSTCGTAVNGPNSPS